MSHAVSPSAQRSSHGSPRGDGVKSVSRKHDEHHRRSDNDAMWMILELAIELQNQNTTSTTKPTETYDEASTCHPFRVANRTVKLNYSSTNTSMDRGRGLAIDREETACRLRTFLTIRGRATGVDATRRSDPGARPDQGGLLYRLSSE